MKNNDYIPEGARVMLTKEQLAVHTARLAVEIKDFYGKPDGLVVVVVLEGARRFATDLLAAIGWRLEPVYIRASSYVGQRSSGVVTMENPTSLDLSGRRAPHCG